MHHVTENSLKPAAWRHPHQSLVENERKTKQYKERREERKNRKPCVESLIQRKIKEVEWEKR
jgi:hypothetical protein